LAGTTITIDFKAVSPKSRIASHFDRLIDTVFTNFDEGKIRHQSNATNTATLKIALVVKHPDDVTGIDAITFSETEKKLHHSLLWSARVIAPITRSALASFFSIPLRIVTSIPLSRGFGIVLDDALPFACRQLFDHFEKCTGDIFPLVFQLTQRLEKFYSLLIRFILAQTLGYAGKELILQVAVDLVLRWYFHFLNLLTRVFFDRADAVSVTPIDERNGFSLSSGTSRSTDTVNVIFRILRKLVVNYEINIVDIDPAGSDIRCDKNFDCALAKHPQNTLAHRLGNIAMKTIYGVSSRKQSLGAFIDGPFRIAENDREFRLLQVDDSRGQFDAGTLAHLKADLFDRLDRHLLAFDLNRFRFVAKFLNESLDGAIHRCREKERLVLCRKQLQDRLHVLGETHVEHAVSLVEHGSLNAGKIKCVALNQINQAAWSSDDNLRTMLQRSDLAVNRGTSINRRRFQPMQFRCKSLNFSADLYGQFARRANHEHLHITIFRINARQASNAEGSRLSGSCLGEANKIAPLHCRRNGCGLNSRWSLVSKIRDCLK
jgi:hypothetical protein